MTVRSKDQKREKAKKYIQMIRARAEAAKNINNAAEENKEKRVVIKV